MIQIQSYKEFFQKAIEWSNTNSNEDITGGKNIQHLVMAVEENHLVKKVKDKSGIILALRYPPSDSQGNEDNYAERNKCLIFIVMKWDASSVKESEEIGLFAALQEHTKKIKEYLLSEKKEDDFCNTENQLYSPFTTEWEYNIFGGYNGLSVSFDLRNYSL